MHFSCTCFDVPQFFFSFHIGNIHETSCDGLCVSCSKLVTFAAIFLTLLWFSAFFKHFHRILYLRMRRIWKISNFEIFQTFYFEFMVVKYFHILSFSKTHTSIKVDDLSFITFFSSFGLLIIFEFEESKRLVQILVGKPTLAKLHMSKAS